jgi:CubicO group peptidase (beta-lactamase class C family)
MGGRVEPGFEAVREAFEVCHPPEVGGGQLCVYRRGAQVVDVWTGRDPVNDRDYDGDTLGVLMSCTKGAVAIVVHRLAERGVLGLDDPVARWWPEFAANGKAAITIAHCLSHSAGLMGHEPGSGMDGASALDFDRSARALAAMAPLWPPGSAYLYHFTTYGYLLGEVVRRATGKTVGQLFAEEIAGPLGLDMWIGLPDAEQGRVAPHLPAATRLSAEGWRTMCRAMGADPDERFMRAIGETFESVEELIDLLNTPAGRAVEVPAANAVGNARSLARMYAATIGAVDGVRLLKPETVAALRTPRTDHLKGPLPLPPAPDGDAQRFGLGFELPRNLLPMISAGSFGHPGAGGRLGFADPESGFAVGYACNGMLWDGRNPDPRWGWMTALKDAAHA